MTEAQLRNLYRVEMTRFRERLGGPAVRLYLIARNCPHPGACAFRDFGYCHYEGNHRSIHFVRRILLMPLNNVVGLVRHELGHAYDADLHKSGAEQRADDLAEYVTGQKIRYDARDVQTIGAGKYPRPLHLHR